MSVSECVSECVCVCVCVCNAERTIIYMVSQHSIGINSLFMRNYARESIHTNCLCIYMYVYMHVDWSVLVSHDTKIKGHTNTPQTCCVFSQTGPGGGGGGGITNKIAKHFHPIAQTIILHHTHTHTHTHTHHARHNNGATVEPSL